MNAQNSLIHDLWVRLHAELMADKKKSVLMGVLLVVALTIGLFLLVDSAQPREAEAAKSAAAAPTDDPAPVIPSPRPDRSRLAAYLEQIDSTVPRDLFDADYGAYPMAAIKPIRPDSGTSPRNAAALLERAKRRARVLKMAEKLHLQSTMPGDPPTAIINGYVVRPGQQFVGFVIRKITFGSCIVAHDTIEVTLTME